MGLIDEVKNKFKSISIIGLAKNAGKTVTLNYLISKSQQENVTIGLTSTGRDGEDNDLVTNTQKPTIFAQEGVLVATAKQALLLSDAKVEILEVTDYKTPMGDIVIARVVHNGNIQIAGPTNTKEIKEVINILLKFGAEVVFVDGAIDRKAASSPIITDACVIATGAVLSRDMKKVVDKTAYIVDTYKIPQVCDDIRHTINKEGFTCIINDVCDITKLDVKTGITAGKTIVENIKDNSKYVYVKGAITSLLLKELVKSEYIKSVKLIIDDATKIFVDNYQWNEAKKKGLKVETLNSIQVVALTLNPISPEGYYFDSAKFLEQMKYHIKNINIIDVVSGGEQ